MQLRRNTKTKAEETEIGPVVTSPSASVLRCGHIDENSRVRCHSTEFCDQSKYCKDHNRLHCRGSAHTFTDQQLIEYRKNLQSIRSGRLTMSPVVLQNNARGGTQQDDHEDLHDNANRDDDATTTIPFSSE